MDGVAEGESFLNGKVRLFGGDNREILKSIPDDSIDSIVCDPPYALVSIVRRFGNESHLHVSATKDQSTIKAAQYKRLSGGFMGQKWDTGDTAHAVEFWQECLRVLKPGGHVVAFAGTRTYHRLACAIEDAGFEIRDQLQWIFGSGFPKSHDVSKGIDKAAGLERDIIGRSNRCIGPSQIQNKPFARGISLDTQGLVTAPASQEAAQWQGWGTALKPANEPIALARKPLSEKTVAANVLKWGTGAINVDGCRVGTDGGTKGCDAGPSNGILGDGLNGSFGKPIPGLGRWPANVITDGSDEVVGIFPDRNGQQGAVNGNEPSSKTNNVYGQFDGRPATNPRGDSGSAARFFYTAKADSDDRLGSKHPTVKPVDLMQWLVRLVTPKNGVCLDPFAGTGSTAEACYREGMSCILIEREEEYQADIRRRMALVLSGPDERSRESIKAKTKDLPPDHGPLFA